MTDKRSAYERCVADLEMARMLFKRVSSQQQTSSDEVQRVALEAKRLEIKLAAAKLAQSEYHLDALRARVDYLETRSSRDRATKQEEAELEWARGALPVNTATVARLAQELELRKQELDDLNMMTPVPTDEAA
jgi:hypothetical protein